jgi:uncharacterized protein with HEPN domain
MKKKRKPLLFLEDILEAIKRIETYTAAGKDNFMNNLTVQDATFFRLQTIGEAVNQLPEEIKEKYPEIPWRDITDFRNILAHRYWRIDFNVVWTILQPKGDLDKLKFVVQKLIEEINNQSQDN